MKRSIRLERTYPHPIDRVWAALTDPECMAQWLMKSDFRPVLGHKFQFRSKPQPGWSGVVRCEVTELTAPTRLAYTWSGDDDGKVMTTVRWSLVKVPEGTRLVLEHDGFLGIGGVLLSFMLGAGWKKMLVKKLPAVLERLAAG